MPEQNDVSIVIPPEVLTEVKDAVTLIKTKLDPFLVALTPDERKTLPKMSDKTVAFVEKTLGYTESTPDFAPPYMKVDEMKIDLKAVDDLNGIFKPLQQIESNLDDTIMVCGSEAYVSALSYYNSVKMAAKLDIPSAKPIYDDLKKRFTNKVKPTDEPADQG
ncbi:MAG: hypothetical protein JEY94_10155 [Melioribacteraceae bacterium]|nr:hypothetical protein [Melioribacteraceae bacterium]